MDRMGFDLERLLAPDKLDSFLSDTWETRPHVIHRRAPDYYSDLFSLSDLDEVIAFTRPKFTEPLTLGDGPRNAKSFVQGWLADQPRNTPHDFYPGIGELCDAFARGRSVVIRSMQHRWRAVASLCRSFEVFFHCPVHANLYLTPPQSQAFPPHIDTHEVFALQLDGVKHWRLYGQVATLPLMEDKSSLSRASLGVAREIRMETGDLLYLPRGHAHEASTGDSRSLHMTIGVHVYRWVDLLQQALSDVTRRDSRFRESLPASVLGGSVLPDNVIEQFQELLRTFARDAQMEEAARHLDDQFFDGLGMLPGAHFVPAYGVDEMGIATIVEKRAGVICRAFVDGTESVIEFPGGRVAGPARIAEALRFVARTDRFSISELPDDLGDNGKIVLVQRLVRAGLLGIAPHDRNGPVDSTRNGAMHRQLATVECAE